MNRPIQVGDFVEILSASSSDTVGDNTAVKESRERGSGIYIIEKITPNQSGYQVIIRSENTPPVIKTVIIDSKGYSILGEAGLPVFSSSHPHPTDLSSEKHKLKVITFNLAGNAQTNQVRGSEAILVKQCQQRYPQYGGWSGPPVSPTGEIVLSQCTLNAAQWIASKTPDIVGLQESVAYYLPKITSVIQEKTGKTYSYIGDGAYLIYNEETMGPGELLSPPRLYIIQKGRPMIIVWFPQVKILVVNLHAPHKVDLKEAITQTFDRVSLSVVPDRIIMTGDFNDAYYSPLTEINLLGKILKQHDPPSKSCCANNYRAVGDYIFDSDIQAEGYYGIPDDAYDKLMSDHRPVMYEEH